MDRKLATPGQGEMPLKAATINRRLTSINAAHKRVGLDSPATMNHRLVADTLHGIRRTLGVAQVRKKPLTRGRIVKLIGALSGPIAAARDKALVLVGFAGRLRRSELAAVKVEDLTWHRKGVTIANPESYGGHSLRAGFVTEASANGPRIGKS